MTNIKNPTNKTAFTDQLKSAEEGLRSCLLDDWIRLRITRSSEAAFFLQSTEKIQIPCFVSDEFTVVQSSSSLHHSSLLEPRLLRELMLGFDLNIELDLIDDGEFHQRRWWNNHRDWCVYDSKRHQFHFWKESFTIQTISRKRGLIQSGIQLAESIWNRISTPLNANRKKQWFKRKEVEWNLFTLVHVLTTWTSSVSMTNSEFI